MTPQRKCLYSIIILTIFCLVIVMELGNFRAKQLAVDLADNQVKKALDAVETRLDRNALQEVIRTLDEDSSDYLSLRHYLIELKNDYGLADIYLLAKNEQENKWFYAADARMEDDSRHVLPGTAEIRYFGALENILKGKVVEREYHSASGGVFVTSFQAIKNTEGKVLTVIGGDFPAGEMTDFLYLTRYVQLGLIAVSLLLIGGIVLATKT